MKIKIFILIILFGIKTINAIERIEVSSITHQIEDKKVAQETYFEFIKNLEPLFYSEFSKTNGQNWIRYVNFLDKYFQLYEETISLEDTKVIFSIQKIIKKTAYYKINEQFVKEEKYLEVEKTLREKQGTWSCSETNKGGRTGYDATDSMNKIFEIRSISENKITFNIIKEKNKKEFLPFFVLK